MSATSMGSLAAIWPGDGGIYVDIKVDMTCNATGA